MKTTEQTPTDLAVDAAFSQMKRDLLGMCFAVPGEGNIIDTADPKSGRSHIQGENLEEIRRRYPAAVLMPLAEWLEAKTKAQDAPGVWVPVTEERFNEMLNVLPPAAWHNGAFLVGEASDHHAGTGRPRFTCYRERHGEFAEYSRPMTHREFRAEFGNCPNYYGY